MPLVAMNLLSLLTLLAMCWPMHGTWDNCGHVTMWWVVIRASQLSHLGPEAQARNIKQLLVHEHYSNISERNDFALLELDHPVQYSYYLQLTCVPDASLRVSELETCYISGRGSMTARSGESTDLLQKAKDHFIDVNLCNSSRWYRGAIHTHNLCAGYPQGGIDACQGDNGGPLVCKHNNADHFWLVGVTSWGKGCARASHPGVCTSTQHFYDWILVQMGLHPAVRATPSITGMESFSHRFNPLSEAKDNIHTIEQV